ncbi:hypothetical protein ACP4OV_027174 [Aristida adscensionis]
MRAPPRAPVLDLHTTVCHQQEVDDACGFYRCHHASKIMEKSDQPEVILKQELWFYMCHWFLWKPYARSAAWFPAVQQYDILCSDAIQPLPPAVGHCSLSVTCFTAIVCCSYICTAAQELVRLSNGAITYLSFELLLAMEIKFPSSPLSSEDFDKIVHDISFCLMIDTIQSKGEFYCPVNN